MNLQQLVQMGVSETSKPRSSFHFSHFSRGLLPPFSPVLAGERPSTVCATAFSTAFWSSWPLWRMEELPEEWPKGWYQAEKKRWLESRLWSQRSSDSSCGRIWLRSCGFRWHWVMNGNSQTIGGMGFSRVHGLVCHRNRAISVSKVGSRSPKAGDVFNVSRPQAVLFWKHSLKTRTHTLTHVHTQFNE